MDENNNAIVCNSGWKKLYQPILDKIFKYDDSQDSSDKKIGVSRVESCDGKLKFIFVNKDNIPYHLKQDIEEACHESLSVCEMCGTKLNVGTTLNNEYVTCCRECWENFILTKNTNSIWKDYTTGKCYRKNDAIDNKK